MGKERVPATQAIRTLRDNEVKFVLRPYTYDEKGGTPAAATELDVDEHLVIKTLVMQDDKGDPFLVLMHGDKRVSTKALSRALQVKRIFPCAADAAHRHTGYFVGGISPFGTRKPLRVYMEASIAKLPKIYVNAGRRGLLAEMSPQVLIAVLNPTLVNVAT